MFAVGIVAHTSRATQARALQRTVTAQFVSVDNGVLGCDANHQAVQQHLSCLPTTWSVVLEDDAQPVEDFINQLHRALPMCPSPIASFYLGRKRPPHWQKRIEHTLTQSGDASWMLSTHLLHGVGYAIRTDLLDSLLAFDSQLPADQHIGAWAQRYGHLVSYTLPSLVDHRDDPTIVNHPDGQPRRPGRKAWQIGTRDHWTTQTVTL